MPDPEICDLCNGSGENPMAPAGEGLCPECKGEGEIVGDFDPYDHPGIDDIVLGDDGGYCDY